VTVPPPQPGGGLDRRGGRHGAGGVQRRGQGGEREPVGAAGLPAQAGLREERVDGRREVVAGLVAGNARVSRTPRVDHRRILPWAPDGVLAGNGLFPTTGGSPGPASRGVGRWATPKRRAIGAAVARCSGGAPSAVINGPATPIAGHCAAVVVSVAGEEPLELVAGGAMLDDELAHPAPVAGAGARGERLALQPLVVVPEYPLGVHTRIVSERARGPCHATGVRCVRRARRGEGVRPASAWSSRSSAAGNRSTSGSACGSA